MHGTPLKDATANIQRSEATHEAQQRSRNPRFSVMAFACANPSFKQKTLDSNMCVCVCGLKMCTFDKHTTRHRFQHGRQSLKYKIEGRGFSFEINLAFLILVVACGSKKNDYNVANAQQVWCVMEQ